MLKNQWITYAAMTIAIVALVIAAIGWVVPAQFKDQANECTPSGFACLQPRTCVNSTPVNITGANSVCLFAYQGVEYAISLGLGCPASYVAKINSGSGWSTGSSSGGAMGSPLFVIFNYTGIMTYGLGANGCTRTPQDYWNYFSFATRTWLGFKTGGGGVNINPRLPLYMSVIDSGHVMLHVIGNDNGNCGGVYTDIANTATFGTSSYQSTGFSNLCDFSTMFQGT